MPEPRFIFGDPVALPELDGGPDPTDDCLLYQEAVTGNVKRGPVVGSGATSYWARSGTHLNPTTAGDDVVLHTGEFFAKIAANLSTESMLAGYLFGATIGTDYALFLINNDGGLSWGLGGGTAPDVVVNRYAANLLALAAGDAIALLGQAGEHASTTDGTLFYNTALGKLRLREGGSNVYPDNLHPMQTIGDAAATVTATDRWIVFGTALTATRAANMPALSTVAVGHRLVITDDGAINGAKVINVTPNGTDNIQGVNAAYAMTVARTSLEFAKGGSGWLII